MTLKPYAGTSGWSGSETSRDRAMVEDQNGTTSARQYKALNLIRQQQFNGLTWKELSEITGWHHGSASGVLSVLHKEGLIYRLIEKRNRCAIYIYPLYSQNRTLSERKIKNCKHCGGEL